MGIQFIMIVKNSFPYTALPGQNKTGRQEESRQPVWTNRLKSIFSSMDAVFPTRTSTPQERQCLPRLLCRRPLFSSFLINNEDAQINQAQANNSNRNTYWQGQTFEEITGQTSYEDIFPQIPDDLGINGAKILKNAGGSRTTNEIGFTGGVKLEDNLVDVVTFVNRGVWPKVIL
jgi:hypothetical protein